MEWRHTEHELLRAINSCLPTDIVVKALNLALVEFDPRRSARWRNYQYRIYNAPIRSPLKMRRSWHVKVELDLEAMKCGAEYLVGEHDFASFGRAPDKIGHTVRTVRRLECKFDDHLLTIDIEANSFLYRMVRSIVGTLYMVGIGSWKSNVVGEILQACNRNRSGPLAPAQGLTLTKIEF